MTCHSSPSELTYTHFNHGREICYVKLARLVSGSITPLFYRQHDLNVAECLQASPISNMSMIKSKNPLNERALNVKTWGIAPAPNFFCYSLTIYCSSGPTCQDLKSNWFVTYSQTIKPGCGLRNSGTPNIKGK